RSRGWRKPVAGGSTGRGFQLIRRSGCSRWLSRNTRAAFLSYKRKRRTLLADFVDGHEAGIADAHDDATMRLDAHGIFGRRADDARRGFDPHRIVAAAFLLAGEAC